jgi:hypothetical protein
MAGKRRRTKVPPRGQAGGFASGKARQRTDNLEIWLAYQQARDEFNAVKALAYQFGLSRRRIRQIGTGPMPAAIEAVVAAPPPAEEPALSGPGPEAVARQEFVRLLEAVAADLAGIEVYAREIAVALAQAEAGQSSMYSRVGDAEALKRQARLTLARVNRKLNQ